MPLYHRTATVAVPIPAGLFIGQPGARASLSMVAAKPRNASWFKIDADSQALDLVRLEVLTGGDAASALTVAGYSLRPGSLTVDRVFLTGSTDATTIAVKDLSITPVTLTRGYYILVVESTGHSATAPVIRGISAGGTYPIETTDVIGLADPRGGISPEALVNAVGLPASFDLIITGVRIIGPLFSMRTA